MLLQTKQLSRTFTRSGSDFFAVKEADFTIDSSDFVFIVGRSGSGKTTLLNLLSGILEPTSGTVLFEDKDITLMSDTEKSYYRNHSAPCRICRYWIMCASRFFYLAGTAIPKGGRSVCWK